MDASAEEIQTGGRVIMKLLIDVEKDYYEIIKYNVEHGQEYKPFEIIANGIPYEEGPQEGCWKLLPVILTSYPPKHKWQCKRCGHEVVTDDLTYPEFPCEKCGAGLEGTNEGEWKEDAFSIICPFCGMTIDDEVRYLYPDNFDLNFCPNCGKKLRWKGEEE